MRKQVGLYLEVDGVTLLDLREHSATMEMPVTMIIPRNELVISPASIFDSELLISVKSN